MLGLIVTVRVPELFKFEIVESAGELFLYADLGIAQGIEREIWRFSVTTKITSLLLPVALIDKPVIALHRLPYHSLVELVRVCRSPEIHNRC